MVLSRRVICISEICRRRRSLCSGWPYLGLVSQSGRQAVSRLNYWSFAQHALDRERRDGETAANICGVVVMWGLNGTAGRTKTIAQTGQAALKREKLMICLGAR